MHLKHLLSASVSTLVLAVGATFAVTQPAAAKTLQLVTAEPQSGEAQASSMVWFADQLKKRTNGSLEINVLWGGSGAGPSEIPDAVSSGTAAIGDLITPYFPDRFLINDVIGYYLPQPKSPLEISNAMREWNDKYPPFREEMAKNNLITIGHIPLAPYGFLCQKPLHKLSDFKGLRIRSYGFAYPALIEALGAVPVSLTTSDTYNALQRNVIDCTPVNPALAHGWKYDEVAHYFVNFPLGASWGHLLVMNLKLFNGLSKSEQQVLLKLGQEFDVHYAKALEASDAKVKADWAAGGHVKYVDFHVTDAEINKLIQSPGIQAVRNRWVAGAKRRGLSDYQAILDSLAFH
ncbi:Solute-binding protein [Castellaniella defragrans]